MSLNQKLENYANELCQKLNAAAKRSWSEVAVASYDDIPNEIGLRTGKTMFALLAKEEDGLWRYERADSEIGTTLWRFDHPTPEIDQFVFEKFHESLAAVSRLVANNRDTPKLQVGQVLRQAQPFDVC